MKLYKNIIKGLKEARKNMLLAKNYCDNHHLFFTSDILEGDAPTITRMLEFYEKMEKIDERIKVVHK